MITKRAVFYANTLNWWTSDRSSANERRVGWAAALLAHWPPADAEEVDAAERELAERGWVNAKDEGVRMRLLGDRERPIGGAR